ncbi:uncharacterized protein LOC143444274 isoform X4 [Clavelina lepadiformis]|uniref:uncharacterized protein LOC143444274 isoform X4 n=1 Tax=Clavelina lepadiformis TaxID=159417 RepID=UPI004041329A
MSQGRKEDMFSTITRNPDIGGNFQDESVESSLSCEPFEGEFCAKELLNQPCMETFDLRKSNKEDDKSAVDNALIASDFEERQDSINSENKELRDVEKMPKRITSRPQDRAIQKGGHRPTGKSPKLKTFWEPQSTEHRRHSSVSVTSFQVKPTYFSGDEEKLDKEQIDRSTKSGMRRYSSTGDLRNAGSDTSAKRRVLPNLSFCKRVASESDDGGAWSDSQEQIRIPDAPIDRQTLEAQFKLLYHENMKLDKAYEVLQEKVRSESPHILSKQFLSPREAEWQKEKMSLQREIQQLNETILLLRENLKIEQQHKKISKGETNITLSTMDTEMCWRGQLQQLQNVKDEEITRLKEQVSYWMKHSAGQHENAYELKKERVAELEQSEAALKCQIINLENQLVQAKSDLATAKTENDDLGEHCNRLENCLAVLDAEKLLLDELKKENGQLRTKLSTAESDITTLAGKLASLADDNSAFEKKIASMTNEASQHNDDSKNALQNVMKNNKKWKSECDALKERCSILETVKENLVEQMKSLEEDHSNESDKFAEKIRKLNEKIILIQNERESLKDTKEKLDLDQELSLNMTEKLNQRINDLQDHIETLKSQLESQKEKLSDLQDVDKRLTSATKDKCSFEAAYKQMEAENYALQNRLKNEQKRLAESFERANMQLMDETDEMGKRQRNLLTENQALRLRSSSRAFDAMIGQKLRESLRQTVRLCEEKLQDLKTDGGREVMEFTRRRTKVQDSYLAVEFSFELLNPIDVHVLSDEDAAKFLNTFALQLMGTNFEDLRQLQNESPRLDDIKSISQLTDDVKENSSLMKSMDRIQNVISILGDQCVKSISSMYQLLEENKRLQEQLEQSTKAVKETTALQKDINLITKRESVLNDELGSVQVAFEKLSAKTTTLEQEKLELMKEVEKLKGNSNLKIILDETTKLLEDSQLENQKLRSEIKTWKHKVHETEKSLEEKTKSLKSDLNLSLQAESDLRARLDATQRAGEELILRVHEIKEERSRLIEKHRDEKENFTKELEAKNNLLDAAERDKARANESNQILKTEVEKLKEDIQDSLTRLSSRDNEFAEKQSAVDVLSKQYSELELENTELKIKLDSVKTEKESDHSNQIKILQNEKKALSEKADDLETSVQEQAKIMSNLEFNLKNTNNHLYEQQQNTQEERNCLQLEMEELRKSNTELLNNLQNTKNEHQKCQVECEKIFKNKDELQVTVVELNSLIDELKNEAREEAEKKDEIFCKWQKSESEKTELEETVKKWKNKVADFEMLAQKEKSSASEMNTKDTQTLITLEQRLVDSSALLTPNVTANSTKQHVMSQTELNDEQNNLDSITKENQVLLAEIIELKHTIAVISESYWSKKDTWKMNREMQTEAHVLMANSSTSNKASGCEGCSEACISKEKSSVDNTLTMESMSSELERLHNKCLLLESKLAYKTKNISIDAAQVEKRNENSVHRKSTFAQRSELSEDTEKTMENLVDLESDEEILASGEFAVKAAIDRAESSDAERVSIKSATESVGDLSMTESNQGQAIRSLQLSAENYIKVIAENALLKSKIHQLEEDVNKCAGNTDLIENISKLRIENGRLLNMLDQAEIEACTSQKTFDFAVSAVSDKLQELQGIIDDLHAKSAEDEGRHQSSGTESELDANSSGHITDDDNVKEIEKLNLQLKETECLVVACKSKIQHIEKLNEDLRLTNGKLIRELEDVKASVKLPQHPVISSVLQELPQKGFSQTAPAAFANEDCVTPRGEETENETIAFDKVVQVLCDKVVEAKDALNYEQGQSRRLSKELNKTSSLLVSVRDRNADLEQQTSYLNDRLEEKAKQLVENQNKINSLEQTLMANELNSKETLRSKEEELEKLQEQLSTMTVDLEAKTEEFKALDEERFRHTKHIQSELDQLQEKYLLLSNEFSARVSENEDLLNKTQLLQSRAISAQKELMLNEGNVNSLKKSLASLEHENEENNKILADKSSDIDKLIYKVQADESTIIKLKSQINTMEGTICHLRQTIEQSEQSVGTLNVELTEKEEKIEGLSARLEELVETEEALKITMESADDIFAEKQKQHQDELEKLKQGLNRSLSEAKRAEMSNDELQNEIKLLEKENVKLKSEIEGIQKVEFDAEDELEAMQMERALMNTSLENARQESDELEKQNQYLTQVNDDLNVAVDQMQHTIDELNHYVIDLKVQCENFTQEVDELKEKTKASGKSDAPKTFHVQIDEEKKVFMPEHTGHANKEMERLQTELSEAQSKLAQAQKALEEFRRGRATLEDEIRRMYDEREHWTSNLHSPLDPSFSEGSKDFLCFAHQLQYPSQRNMFVNPDGDPRSVEQMTTERLQEESISLRSENEALRSKIASLEGNITEMTERLVPKLELGSIADESEHKPKEAYVGDDDTGRYVDECDVDTTRAYQSDMEKILEEKLQSSEDAAAKLIMQVQEMEEEAERLRSNLQDVTRKNEDLQKEFFGTISENFQAQIDELSRDNSALKDEVQRKTAEVAEKDDQLTKTSMTETQWRHRYQEVQKIADELRERLQRAEADNHDLQGRLIDLDQECQSMLSQEVASVGEISESKEMRHQPTCDAETQTIPLNDLLKELKNDKKIKVKVDSFTSNGGDTENDVSDIDSSSDSNQQIAPAASASSSQGALPTENFNANLADDKLLQQTILNSSSTCEGEKEFDSDYIPPPFTNSEDEVTISQVTDAQHLSTNTVKSLKNEILGYQLMLEKLKRRNQELLEGSGAAMTQDDKEALECEVNALRGQVALLERNNRIFSDRERNELKQDLDLANKRCNNYQAQLQSVKESLEFSEVEKIKELNKKLLKQIEELEKQLQVFQSEGDTDENDDYSDGSSKSNGQEKYARLLELEEEAEELKQKMEDKDEEIKDRDVMVEELQHQLENTKKKQRDEIQKLRKNNEQEERKLQEEIEELVRDVEESKEMIKLKQENLKNKCDQLDKSDDEIQKLEKDILKKNQEIDRLQWEVDVLRKENDALQQRINKLKEAISSSHDPDIFDITLSPIPSLRSPSNVSFHSHPRSGSDSSSPKLLVDAPGRQNGISNRSADSVDSDRNTSLEGSPRLGRRRKIFSLNHEEDTPTSALREGIEEAKQTVHQMGDVLDTPRISPARRSRVSTPERNVQETASHPAATQKHLDVTSSAGHNGSLQRSRKRSSSSSSSNSFSDESSCTNHDEEDQTFGDAATPKSTKETSPIHDTFIDEASLSQHSQADVEIGHNHANMKADILLNNSALPLSTITFSHATENGITHNERNNLEQNELSRATIPLKNEVIAAENMFNPELPEKHDIIKLGESADTPGVLTSEQGAEKKRRTSSSESVTPVAETVNQSQNDLMQKVSEYSSSADVATLEMPDVGRNTFSPNIEAITNVEPDEEGFFKYPATKIDSGVPVSADTKTASPLKITTEVDSKMDNDPEVEKKLTKPLQSSIHALLANDKCRSSGKQRPVKERISSTSSSESDFIDTTDRSLLHSLPTKKESNLDENGKHLKQMPQIEKSPESTIGLLPDDRTVLMQEISKARDEARKWFAEVAQSDRDKRLLGRRLEALENELVRLKSIETNYEMLKKYQEEMQKVSHDLELVRVQADTANKKAEEARERNSLLKAQLLDKEEVENQNDKLKQNLEALTRKNASKGKNPGSLPLSELQKVSATPSHLTESKTSADQKQLREIKDSFEYIASNAKVSQLKRKCLERDQLLAKLLLKIRKQKSETAVDDASDTHDESIASSSGLEKVLAEAEHYIRSGVVQSDLTTDSDASPEKKLTIRSKDTAVEDNDFLLPQRPSSPFQRYVNPQSSKSFFSSPSHRIYVAKHDYTPSKASTSRNGGHIPTTHSLLQDLPLLSGDTVVAIGNPDQRNDGKMYQLAEVRGKIGFVPLAHLVAAEQVEGMQAFVQERGKANRKRSTTSSPEKIINLYKKLGKAHLMVADKMDRKGKISTRSPSENEKFPIRRRHISSNDRTTSDSSSHILAEDNTDIASTLASPQPRPHIKEKLSQNTKKSKRSKVLDSQTSFTSERSDFSLKLSKNEKSRSFKKRKSLDSSKRKQEHHPVEERYVADVRRSSTSLADSSFTLSYDAPATSTPILKHPKHYRPSSLRSKRSTSSCSLKSDILTEELPKATVHSDTKDRSSTKTQSRRSNSTLKDSGVRNPSVLPLPQPPTFLVIEKTMGQKSMIICWTPPLLDMISRSNNIPVVGYEISIDKQRKVQISGAYTNKAILGDLDLTKTFAIEVRTVSSVGTLSPACEVMFSPNSSSPLTTPTLSHASINAANSALSASDVERQLGDNRRSPVRMIQRATVLYNYDPNVDSPYKSHEDEISLKQGDEVLVVGSPRPDGFCNVQVGRRHGLAPVAFFRSDCDITMGSDASSTSDAYKTKRYRTGSRRTSTKSISSLNSSLSIHE